MDTPTLQQIVISALEDIKARDIEAIDTTRVTALFDSIVVASAESSRQTRALARNVIDKVKEAGGEVVSIEGEDSGEWVLVDLGNIVVHVMQPAVRAYYRLEELWSTTPASRRNAA
ncbi:ribosome silencing factor [Thauera sinica]|uniref:Ribosomal silencing factor RsfS n=1 Tax=Thauera sinica TaxID=2665146 RepID=A0ABW1APX2_9RHOO|nr:ribosome silencing factor [Thauera sp. K11]ATE62268.1 ribosome silencing factor [Thauera sp. K11]